MIDTSTPFPLDGGRVGVGGAHAGFAEDGAKGFDEASRSSLTSNCANTPTQPSPIEGEGFARERTSARTIRQARSMRATPTRTEAKLWERLRSLPVRFRRQAAIGAYVADFVCHRAALVVEVDGGIHNQTEVALRDLKRDAWFESQGYVVIRLGTQEVEADIDAVVVRIRNLASNRIGKAV